mgnify:CR=1 FL=1
MIDENLVSVVMPAHDSGKFIFESINSVLVQTYNYFELLVVDDGSTDDTADIVNNITKTDSRVKYIKLKGTSGVVAARQKAIDVARGQYIAFLDSDDLWLPHKLEEQLKFMKDNESKISCTTYEQITEDGKRNGKKIVCPQAINYNRILLDCPIGNLTVMIDRFYIPNITIPEVAKREDFALWLSLTRKYGNIHGLNKILALYRVRSGSVSRNKIALIPNQWNVYRNVEHLGLCRSLFHVSYYCLIKLLKLK